LAIRFDVLWGSRWQRNNLSTVLPLSFAQISADGLQVVIELCGVFFAQSAYFFNDGVSPHGSFTISCCGVQIGGGSNPTS
jgi:hypothetical protein